MRLAAASAALFVVIAALVALGVTRAFDAAALATLQDASTPASDLIGSILTVLGGSIVTSVAAVALAFVWWRRSGLRGLAPLLLFAGVGVELILKLVVPQLLPPRDLSRDLDLLPLGSVATPYSFPSGHVFRTTFLAVLLGARATPAWRAALVVLVAAMALARIALAQHWASDVVGGILLGIAAGALAISLGRRA